MALRKALVVSDAGSYEVNNSVEIPVPQPGMMLCRVIAVALNPIDAKSIDYSPIPGSVGGHDFAGEVVQLGAAVTRFKKGDRIFGTVFGLNPEDKASGAFSDYILAVEDLSCHVPEFMTFEEASTLGLAVGTNCLIHHFLCISSSGSKPKHKPYILVSGGATSTGQVAIQLFERYGSQDIH